MANIDVYEHIKAVCKKAESDASIGNVSMQTRLQIANDALNIIFGIAHGAIQQLKS